MIEWQDELRWRLLPSMSDSGSSHMALDQTLLESAATDDFPPTIRFYRWSPPAISIGRFQDISDIDLEACTTHGIEVTRRPTGGKCLLHLDDFTYSLVLPSRLTLPDGIVEAYTQICEGILAALSYMGLPAAIQPRDSGVCADTGGACFAVATQADVEYKGRKICGSAQVRRNGAILQHGSILIADNSFLLFELLRYSDELQKKEALSAYRGNCIHLNETGLNHKWDDIALSFIQGFRDSFGVEFKEGLLSPWEEDSWHYLATYYRSSRWLLQAKSDEISDHHGIFQQGQKKGALSFHKGFIPR